MRLCYRSLVDTGNRIIAAGTQTPSRIAPEYVPVAATYPGYDCNTWYGLLAPAATPKEIIARLNREAVAVLRTPELGARLANDGTEIVAGTPD